MRQFGRYLLESVHGSGAFATVWRAHDPELDIDVAVKVLADNWIHHADVRERFLEEARLLRRVHDPGVIRVYDVGVHEDRPYFVMDFISGGTVADLQGIRAEVALSLAAQAARAVHALHQAGVVHRDIKPSNLLIERSDPDHPVVVVADLGSAKRLAEASGITVTTGTPSYMPPEQAGGHGIDARCDVYALGVVTYQLLTGALPFDVRDPMSLLTRSVDARPAALRLNSDALDVQSVQAVLWSALATDPQRRPHDAGALAESLEHVIAGQSVALPVPHRQCGPWQAIAVCLLLFVLAAAFTWGVLTLL